MPQPYVIATTHSKFEQSAFFILNVWKERVEGERVEWRGQALHVDSGVVYAFEDWPDLVDFIADALDNLSICAGRAQREVGAGETLTSK